jgi:large subunit ribosomal protein L23
MNRERVFRCCSAPHVSEKAAIVADANNQYVFKVAVDATKGEIRKSVEQLFKVKVEDVQTLKVKGKVKRNRYGFSTKPTWKKGLRPPRRGSGHRLRVGRVARVRRAGRDGSSKEQADVRRAAVTRSRRQQGAAQGCALRAPAREAVA